MPVRLNILRFGHASRPSAIAAELSSGNQQAHLTRRAVASPHMPLSGAPQSYAVPFETEKPASLVLPRKYSAMRV